MKKIMFIGLLYSVIAWAKPIGQVVDVTNKVIAQKGDKQRVLTSGASIYTGEAIITQADAKTKLQYTNGTVVTMQKNSNYKTIAYNPNGAIKLKAELKKGAMEYQSTGKKKSVIQTPVVALAIQGTQFKAIATPQKTYLDVSEGRVQAGSQIIGPSQTYSSGSFNSQQQFRAESIPWDAYSSEPTASLAGENSLGGINTLITASDTTLSVNDAIIPSSVINSIVAIELVEISILNCS